MRHYLVLVHRWVGLAMTAFLVVVALTGSVIAFQEELDHWLNTDLFRVAVRDAPELDPFTLREKAEASEPRAAADFIRLGRRPGDAFVVFVAPKADPATGRPFELPFNEMFLDPYTGERIGVRERGEVSLGRRSIVSFLYRLHYALALPESIVVYGVTTLGIVALAWTIDCFVAFYLTFPLKISAVRSGAARRSWWSRWRPAWLVRWSGGFYRLNFDIHRAFGLWTWAMLFVFAWSGVAFNLASVYRPVMGVVFDMGDMARDETPLEKPLENPALGFRAAYDRAREAIAKAATENGFSVEGERAFGINRAVGQYVYVVRSSKDWSKGGGVNVTIDANDGSVKRLIAPGGEATGETITMWLVWLHMAAVFGLPMQIFVCAMGFVITALCVTGVYIWWKKRAARSARPRRESGSAAKIATPAAAQD
jgi:uncharacterized iron-regulated membrane protein